MLAFFDTAVYLRKEESGWEMILDVISASEVTAETANEPLLFSVLFEVELSSREMLVLIVLAKWKHQLLVQLETVYSIQYSVRRRMEDIRIVGDNFYDSGPLGVWAAEHCHIRSDGR